LLTGAVLAAVVALVAYRAHTLTANGSIAAFFVGTVIFGAGGWPYAALLFAFFIPSTLLSRLGRERKRHLRDVDKSRARNAWQVLANGGVAAACALGGAVHHGTLLHYAYAGALAAASSDTWGTEIGTMSRMDPRSILTFKRIPSGLSGGVTLAGTLAEAGGAAMIAAVAAVAGVASAGPVVLGGFAGALADSLLGAGVQSLRFCTACGCACETDPHHCGQATKNVRGFPWFNNDVVNACATLVGAAFAVMVAQAF